MNAYEILSDLGSGTFGRVSFYITTRRQTIFY